MELYFLGIDVGGTKTHALIADEQGQAVGLGHAGAGNYEVVGWDGLTAALRRATEEALASADVTKSDIAGAGFGIAGYDWPGEREPHLRSIATLDLSCPFVLENDTMIGLVAGAPKGWGVGVVAGTGCNCWGRDAEGREGRVTGEGGLFAEYGGGGDLVYRAIQSISLAWSLRGPETALTEAFIAQVGAVDVDDLLEGLVLGRYAPSADLAPLVFRVAAEGDPVAIEIIQWAGRELGGLAVGVIRQLGLEAAEVDVVRIGSLFNGSPLLSEAMLATVQAVAPKARLLRLSAPPVVGGVLLGMEQAGLDFRALRGRLLASTATRFLP